MDKIIKLVVLAVILYVAYTAGLPWVKGLLRNSPSSFGNNAGEEGLCVLAAESAVDDFGDHLLEFSSPPIDVDAWDAVVSKTRDDVYEAQRGCRCDHPACRKAAQALSSLGDMVTEYDNSVRNGRGLPANGARRLESLYDAVDQARSMAQ